MLYFVIFTVLNEENNNWLLFICIFSINGHETNTEVYFAGEYFLTDEEFTKTQNILQTKFVNLYN